MNGNELGCCCSALISARCDSQRAFRIKFAWQEGFHFYGDS